MNFNSIQFLVFFPVVVCLYALAFGSKRARLGLLLLASYVFYMSWNWRYAGLILFSTLVDYLVGLRMGVENKEKTRRSLLILSLVMNLGLLAYFKYNNFFVDTSGELLAWLGFQTDISFLRHRFLLPVGISFYTFQSLSYTIDLFRRRIPVERSFPRFALYVAFFPQLVAGPIVRAADFLPQLRGAPPVSREKVHQGLALIFRGLFKKVVLADLLAGLGVDAVFANPGDFSSLSLLLAIYGICFQFYNDFSGYSDIAIGTARVLGFNIPENFNRPFLSRNFREFWTRWHISLSSWLRDYLYIPLGGSRGTPNRVRFNLMATMVLGGLWHGAALNFLVWGFVHGMLLVFSRPASKERGNDTLWKLIRQRLVFFHLFGFTMLLFRASTVADFLAYLKGLFTFSTTMELSPVYVSVLAMAAVVHFTPKRFFDDFMHRFAETPAPVQAAVYAALILLLSGLSFGAPAFIYFQF